MTEYWEVRWDEAMRGGSWTCSKHSELGFSPPSSFQVLHDHDWEKQKWEEALMWGWVKACVEWLLTLSRGSVMSHIPDFDPAPTQLMKSRTLYMN